MKYGSDKHHRRSIRLNEYDYAQSGMYYITLCVNKRLCLFGDIKDGIMELNNAGKIVNKIWREIPEYYSGVEIDEYIMMPNHFHGIIVLKNEDAGAPPRGRPLLNPKNGQASRFSGTPTVGRLSLGDVVGRFESLIVHQYMPGVRKHEWKPFYKK